jgi:hypothetical protein
MKALHSIAHSQERVESLSMCRSLHLAHLTVLWTLCVIGISGTFLHAQSYLSSTGSPSFGVPYPAEMGTIDAATGDLHLEIPLGSYPQRGGTTAKLSIAYDSHIWSIESPFLIEYCII